MKEIGSRIREVREREDLSQKAFAQRLSTSSGYVSEVEQGKSVPGAGFLGALRREFRVDLNALLGEASGSETLQARAQESPSLARDEARLLRAYRRAPTLAQKALLKLAEAEAARAEALAELDASGAGPPERQGAEQHARRRAGSGGPGGGG